MVDQIEGQSFETNLLSFFRTKILIMCIKIEHQRRLYVRYAFIMTTCSLDRKFRTCSHFFAHATPLALCSLDLAD